MRAAAAAGADHRVERDAHLERLGQDLVGARDVPERTDRVRPTAGDDVGGHAASIEVGAQPFHRGWQVRPSRHDGDRGDAEKVEQEVVARSVAPVAVGDALLEDEMALEALAGRGCGRQAAVVGLDRPGGDDCPGSLREGIGDQELELARLVPASGESEQVVTLDPETRTRQQLAQPIHRLDRCDPARVDASRKGRQVHSRQPRGSPADRAAGCGSTPANSFAL
jgi:hypothetical protein